MYGAGLYCTEHFFGCVFVTIKVLVMSMFVSRLMRVTRDQTTEKWDGAWYLIIVLDGC